jgi:quercetin dioxygenase-like cupin family protein
LELGQIALSYDKLIRLCRALEVDLERFVARDVRPTQAPGRRSVTRNNQGEPTLWGGHAGRASAADLLAKSFTPLVLQVTATSLTEHGPLHEVESDVYLHVLAGEALLHSETYAPLSLKPGDSIYFDGRMRHALLAAGDGPAQVLAVAAGDLAVKPNGHSRA